MPAPVQGGAFFHRYPRIYRLLEYGGAAPYPACRFRAAAAQRFSVADKRRRGGPRVRGSHDLYGFQTEEEQKAQKEFMDELCNTKLKDTDNLEEKYPVVYPTTIDTELGKQMKAAILNDFENYNSGYGAWDKWTDEFYAENASLNYKGDDVSLDEYKDIVKDEIGNTSRVRINNILVSEDWAAIHFWTVTTNEDGTKEADNHMQFLHFVQNGDKVQVDNCFMK